MESEEQQLNDAPQAELDQEVESGEEEKEDQADNLSSEEDEEKENTPIAGTQKAAVPASVCLPPVDLVVSRSDSCRVFCSAPSLAAS